MSPWWTAWRQGTDLYVQQRHLVEASMAPARTAGPAALPYELVGPRATRTAEGTGISKWRVELDDLRDFVAQRGGSSRA